MSKRPAITSAWGYADFRTKPTVAEQLEAARLHDSEVRNAALETGSGEGKYTRLAPNYLKELNEIIQQLETKLATTGSVNARSRQPTNLRPRF